MEKKDLVALNKYQVFSLDHRRGPIQGILKQLQGHVYKPDSETGDHIRRVVRFTWAND